VNENVEKDRAGLSVTKTADEQLDEVLLESFPASDPPSSWSGLAQLELVEKLERETGEEPA
jgi:hypothetical protein